MKKKSILSVFILAVFYYLIISLCSCNKENPVISHIEEFDSARYNSHRDIVSVGYYTYVIDSVNIFLGDYSGLSYFRSNNIPTYIPYGDNFFCRGMGGVGYEMYFVGNSFGEQTGFERPRIKKWNNMSFEEIPIVDTSNKNYYLQYVYLSFDKGLFMGGSKGNVLRYYNGNFTKYQFDTTYLLCKFFEDEQQNLYYWGWKDSMNQQATAYKEYQYFYKFSSSYWQLVYTRISVTDSTQINNLYPYQIGNEILAVGDDGIYKFDGSAYLQIKHLDAFQSQNGLPIGGSNIGGSGSNNFIIVGIEGGNHNVFYNWNGNKWSKEYTGTAISFYDVKYANDCYIATCYFFQACDYFKFTKK